MAMRPPDTRSRKGSTLAARLIPRVRPKFVFATFMSARLDGPASAVGSIGRMLATPDILTDTTIYEAKIGRVKDKGISSSKSVGKMQGGTTKKVKTKIGSVPWPLMSGPGVMGHSSPRICRQAPGQSYRIRAQGFCGPDDLSSTKPKLTGSNPVGRASDLAQRLRSASTRTIRAPGIGQSFVF